MRKLLTPDLYYENIFAIDVDQLESLGIKGLITDMDNTLVPWSDRSVSPRLAAWFKELKNRGFKLFIISNNSKERGGALSKELEIPAIWYAIKPRRGAFRKALVSMDLPADQVAVVGDQIFTDVLGGNRLGLLTILVDPLSEKEFFTTKLVRALEKKALRFIKIKGKK